MWHAMIDDRFGSVDVGLDADAGLVTVLAEALPETTVTRDGPAVIGYAPIGSRDPAALALHVAGVQQQVRPAKAGLSRRSYRVHARVDDTDLLFAPSSPTTARLVRGRSYQPELELGVFERTADGVLVAWAQDVKVLGRTVPALPPEPAEAAVGYALAAAFGTGASFFLFTMINGMGETAPW